LEKLTFTAPRVDAMRCRSGRNQTIYWDPKTPGLGLRVTAAGAKSFIFESRLHGRTLRVTIGDRDTYDIKNAQTRARELKMLTDKGIDPRQVAKQQAREAEEAQARKIAEERRGALLVSDAWNAYLEHHRKRWSPRHTADHLNLAQEGGRDKRRGPGKTATGVLQPLLGIRMVDITPTVLIDWQARESTERPTTARRGFELFRAFWRWCATRTEYREILDLSAVEDRDLRQEVPCRRAMAFDVLERGQLRPWFAAVRALDNPVVSAYLQALVLTGARREEMAELQWEHVDFRWGSLWVKDKVEKEGRRIPLTPYLADLLGALKAINEAPPKVSTITPGGTSKWKPSKWVFSSNSASGRIVEPRIPHNRALENAGLDHVTIHGLRRTFASLAEWVEMPTGIVAQIMGHKPSATAERHYKRRPLDLLAEWHKKYERWILEQASVAFDYSPADHRLRSVG
jgi:integrase